MVPDSPKQKTPQTTLYFPPRRIHVYCSQFAQCRWRGQRKGISRQQVTAKPCPRCGKQVAA